MNDGDRRLDHGLAVLAALSPEERVDALIALADRAREKAERDAEAAFWDSIYSSFEDN